MQLFENSAPARLVKIMSRKILLKNYIALLSAMLLLLLVSCLNKYEKEMVGQYRVKTYKFSLGESSQRSELPKLTLLPNKTIIIENGKVIIKGEWKVEDYGDFTLLEIFFNNELFAQARFSHDGEIIFDNYRKELFRDKFDDISFVKVVFEQK